MKANPTCEPVCHPVLHPGLPWGPSKGALGRWPPPEQKEGKPTDPQASPFYSNSTLEVRKQGSGREFLSTPHLTLFPPPAPCSARIPRQTRVWAVGISPFAQVAEPGREARGRLKVLCNTLRSRLSLRATLR